MNISVLTWAQAVVGNFRKDWLWGCELAIAPSRTVRAYFVNSTSWESVDATARWTDRQQAAEAIAILVC